jgi:multisubunit Na+/H+ antiporter MnhF subunit
MTVWQLAATGILLAYVPCGIATFRGALADRLVALEMAGLLTVLELVLLAEAFNISYLYDLALTLAILSLGATMVFARFLERWM